MDQDPCCPTTDAPQPGAEEADLDLLDPTMSSCCRRDMLEQRRVERAKEALLSVDRVDARNRIERAVISATPPEQPDAENSSDLDDFLDGALTCAGHCEALRLTLIHRNGATPW